MKHNTDYIGALIECNSEKAEYAEINQDFKEDISNLLTIGKIYNFHVSNIHFDEKIRVNAIKVQY